LLFDFYSKQEVEAWFLFVVVEFVARFMDFFCSQQDYAANPCALIHATPALTEIGSSTEFRQSTWPAWMLRGTGRAW
jgi:hypothetical protein